MVNCDRQLFFRDRLISNHFFLKKGRDKVEWFYCFDVHLNSFVPLALIVFGIQMPLIGGVVTPPTINYYFFYSAATQDSIVYSYL